MTEPKRCLGCGYILDHLPEPRCPECGRGFDPGDSETYASPEADGRDSLWTAVGGVVALIAAILLIMPMSTVGAAKQDLEWLHGWGGSLVMGLVGLGVVCEVAAAVLALRALRRPRYAVVNRGAALAACLIVALLFAGCGELVVGELFR